MTVIVCAPLRRACWCCDASRPHGGDWIVTAEGHVYCSLDCHDDWEEHLAQQARARAAEWCPTCGYDRHEHAPACADWLAHQQERAERPELYDGLPS